ncbi:hypothetical protein MIND_01266800 [Mycena indigotica]|uniref:Cytochrome P450 n=1 Tax=Mycena indigotica TaxID=2126181 RepID=A0A8H6S2H0_9AGAR|nr:uncharacterized protein MIND_01266800 [Mycena indigotica]KAF7291232.1 hypothetical protein MIND_01266800 [Mycena indigotica]
MDAAPSWLESVSLSNLSSSFSLVKAAVVNPSSGKTQIAVPLLATAGVYVAIAVMQRLYSYWRSSIRTMMGPPNGSLLLGNVQELMDDFETTNRWRRQFGHIFKFKSLMSATHIHVQDIKAINHMIHNMPIYQKAPYGLHNSKRTLGNGLLAVENDEHKRQRKILNQAFAPSQIRLLTETFLNISVQCRDMWLAQFAKDPNADHQVIDIFDWFRKLTLDVIGQAGFGYDMDALEVKGQPNELNDVLTKIFHAPHSRMLMGFMILQAMVPAFRLIPFPGTHVFVECKNETFRIGGEILQRAKDTLFQTGAERVEVGSKRSVLSLLLRANVNPEIPVSQRLTDDEVIAQIPTLIVAGHESTSSAVSWAVSFLAGDQARQNKLREELQGLPEVPTMDELNNAEYLEQVVRETLRMHPSLVFTQRMAMQEDVLPLGKPYIDANGKTHDSIYVTKGQMIHIPLLAVNNDPEIWGPDAHVFNPERWDKTPEAVNAIPGVWANTLAFFGGPHACIGYRFALAEIKSILFVMLRTFEFSHVNTEAGPLGGMACKAAMIPGGSMLQHPMDLNAPEKGSCLPVKVKLL